MLSLLLRRLRRSKYIPHITLATSDHMSDDPIEKFAHKFGIDLVRGPLDDVLTRFLLAIEDHDGPVVRITGDCPLIDPKLVDRVIACYQADDGIYASNTHPRTFPDGLDVEVIDADALRNLAAQDLSDEEREHVTLGLHNRPPIAGTWCVCLRDFAHVRWTVDTADDLSLMRSLVRRLGYRRYVADWTEILETYRSMPAGRREIERSSEPRQTVPASS